MDPEFRWRTVIAVIASYSDACRRAACPNTQTAPAVLYAALKRGRDCASDGAAGLFEHIRKAVADTGANPLTDPIFESSDEFRPEVALLAREKEVYERDMKRARRAMVAIPSYKGTFDEFYDPKRARALLTTELEPRPDQLSTDGPPVTVDGVYLRDPDCILFKELARMDTENSSMGRGFLFTAVAYSAGRMHARSNQSNYYFSLDPERSGKLTLYPVWCRLQSAEIRGLLQGLSDEERRELRDKEARGLYVKRAAHHGGLFSDPWFAGDNYRATIVATPFRGTEIGSAGTAADLMDDEVTTIVRKELEYQFYSSEARAIDYSGSILAQSQMSMAERVPAPRDVKFRFCMAPLVSHLEIKQGLQSQQIGEHLWSLLQPAYGELPADFVERHLTQDKELIAVWSRHGLAIAFLPEAQARVERVSVRFAEVVRLLESLLETVKQREAARLSGAENLLQEVAILRHELSMPGGMLAFRRFVEAIGFHETIAIGRDLLSARADHALSSTTQEVATSTRDSAKSMSESIAAIKEGNQKIELLEILFATFYSIELLHILLDALSAGAEGAFVTRTLTLVGAVIAGLASLGFTRKRAQWSVLTLVPVITFCLLILGFVATFEPFASMCRKLLKHG